MRKAHRSPDRFTRLQVRILRAKVAELHQAGVDDPLAGLIARDAILMAGDDPTALRAVLRRPLDE